MIKFFSVKNFFSIKDEIIFEGDLGTERYKSTPPHNAFVIYGANASGKTNFLKALTFVLTFMQKSFFRQEPDKPIPIEPFALQQDKPTEFKLDILINKHLYSYQLTLTREKVLFEKLEQSGKRKPIFEREGESLIHLNNFSERQKKLIEEDLQSNVSLVSFLSRFKSVNWAKELTELIIESNVTIEGTSIQLPYEREFAKKIASLIINDEKRKKEILNFLKIADTEIIDFNLLEKSPDNFIHSLIENKKEEILNFVHKGEDKNFSLEFRFESSGTKKLFLSALPLFAILSNGGIFIWDEISADLHFKIAEYIVKLFQNSENSQIFCTTHNPSLISSCFDKNTIWFTEKENGVTDLYCAADFEELKGKKNLDLETLYKIGRLGAVPRTFYPQD